MTSDDASHSSAASDKLELLECLLREEGVEFAESPVLRRRLDHGVLPLSFAQQRIWFIEQLDPGTSGFNVGVGIRLTGSLNVEALAESLREIQRRHEVLRTTFVSVGGEACQLVGSDATIKLELVDLTALNDASQEYETMRLAEAEANRPFDLATGPLIRTTLLKRGGAEYVLFLTMHHIVSDGWSIDVLFNELAQIYRAVNDGEPATLSALPIQFADYAIWETQRAEQGVWEAELAYWKHQLAGSPALQLPVDRNPSPSEAPRGASQPFELPRALSSAIKEIGEREGCTLFMTLLAAFQAVLHGYTGQGEIVVGSPLANRTRPETERLIGCFMNPLPLRTNLAGNPTFRQLLARVQKITLGALNHQSLPFNVLVNSLMGKRDLRTLPFFEAMFLFQSFEITKEMLPGVAMSVFDLDKNKLTYPVALHVRQHKDRTSGVLLYDQKFEGTLGQFANDFTTTLQAIAHNPDQRLSAISLFSTSRVAAKPSVPTDDSHASDLSNLSTIEFLSLLRRLDIQLWVDKGRLCYRAPTHALTADLRSQLADRRPDVVAFLQAAGATFNPDQTLAGDSRLGAESG